MDFQAATATSSTLPSSVLWPVSFESLGSRARNGVFLSSVGASMIGSVMGLARDTSPGTYALTTGFNTAAGASVWFALRELFISPALLKCGVTEEARRRYEGVLLERGLRGPLEDQAWLTMRTDRIIDTAITSTLFFAAAPPLYQEMKARVSHIKPIRNPLSVTLGSAAAAGLVSALFQWICNELRIHDWKKYRAYDSYGPIPDVDVLALRKAQREQLLATVEQAQHPAAALRQQREEKEREEALQREIDDALTPAERVRRRRSPFSWARFKEEGLPSVHLRTPQETFDQLEKEVEGLEKELEAVRATMREMHVPLADFGAPDERRLEAGRLAPQTGSLDQTAQGV